MSIISLLIIITILYLIPSLNCKIKPLSDEGITNKQSLALCILTISEKYFHQDEIITVSLGPDLNKTTFSEIAAFGNIVLRILFNKIKWSMIVKQPNYGRDIVIPGGGFSGPKGIGRNFRGSSESETPGQTPGLFTNIQFRISDNYILQLRNWEDIDNHMVYLTNARTWNPQARFVVVFTAVNFTPTEVEYIIRKLWECDVLNGVVLINNPEDDHAFNIFSWFPFGDGRCGDQFNKVEHMDSCKFGVLTDNKDLFPNKLPSMLNNCTVRVRTLDYPPFVVGPKQVGNSTKYRIHKGLEIQIMNMASRAANIFMQYEIIKGESWGEIGPMGNGSTGIIGALMRGDADLCIGSFAASFERHMILDSTSAYFEDSLGFCVPHSAEKSHIEKLSGIMTFGVWVSLSITITIYIVITRALSVNNLCERHVYRFYGSVTMKIFAVSLGHAINIQPSSFRVRGFLMMWIIFSLHLDTAYQTYLMSTLTNVDYVGQIKTVKDILDSDLTILLRPADKRYYNAFMQKLSPQAVEIINRAVDCNDIDECLKRTAFQKDSVIATSRLYIQFAKNSYITKSGLPLLYCLEEKIVSYPLVSYARVGFPLLIKIDKLISSVNCGGFIQYFAEDLFRKEKLARHSSNDTNDVFDEAKKQLLTFEHIAPMFFVLLIGYTTALYVLIMELVYYKKLCRFTRKLF